MKILVIGASGYLGNTIYKKLKNTTNHEIYGTCFKHFDNNLLQVNVLNKSDLDKIVLLKPDIIIWCIMNKEHEMEVSNIGVKYLIKNISDNTRFIYISTTVGRGKNQTEEAVPYKRSDNEYLYQYINGKIEGENIVKQHSNHVIIRPGSIYGYDYDGKMDCRMKDLLSIADSGQKYLRTANMYLSYVNVIDLADAVIELIANDFVGTMNISGENPVSYYDFYVYLAKLMNIDYNFIIPDYKDNDVYHNLSNERQKSILKSHIKEIKTIS